MSSLRFRVLRGISVVGGLQIFRMAVAAVTSVLLYRLLSAKDFGLYALCETVFVAASTFSEMGMENVVTQYPLPGQSRVLQTGFILRAFFTVAGFLCLFFGAGAISRLIRHPEIERLIQVFSANLGVALFVFKSEVFLRKNLQFDKFIIPEMISSLSAAGVSLTLAWLGFGAWSLIFSGVVNQGLRALALWRISPQPLLVKPDKKLFLPLLREGVYNFFTKILYYVLPYLINFFVARLLGIASLGYYYLAYNWANGFVTYVVQLLGRVVFPAVASVESDRVHVKEMYQEYVTRLSLLAAPFNAGLATAAGMLIPILLGTKWEPAVAPCRIMCLYGYLGILFGASLIVLQSLGLFKKVAQCITAEFFVILALIYPAATQLGLSGVAWSMTIGKVVGTALMVQALVSALKSSWFENLKVILPSLVCSAIMVLSIWIFDPWIRNTAAPAVIRMFLIILFGALVYFGSYFLLHRGSREELRSILRDVAMLFGK